MRRRGSQSGSGFRIAEDIHGLVGRHKINSRVVRDRQRAVRTGTDMELLGQECAGVVRLIGRAFWCVPGVRTSRSRSALVLAGAR